MVGIDLHVDVALVGLTADPARAIAGAVAALGIGTTVAAGSEVEALVAAVEALAPAQVCIVADGLDDDHAPVDEESRRGRWTYCTLLRDLPASGHLLVVSRRPIDLRTARIELSGSMRWIDGDVLASQRRRASSVGGSVRSPDRDCLSGLGHSSSGRTPVRRRRRARRRARVVRGHAGWRLGGRRAGGPIRLRRRRRAAVVWARSDHR
ncbi:MAG: hypothetical protein R2705_17640 [Ilumatobacteraceae bacterium]